LELLVGSEDFDIRVFKQDEIVAEMSETEAISALCPLRGSRFAYSLANGTVGVYENENRQWRIKSKNQAVTMCSFDLDGDGVPELIAGWSNGKVDARNAETGEVVFKDTFHQSVAGIVPADYRMEGEPQLICCSIDGEVRGYGAAPGGRRTLMEVNIEQDAVRDLSQKKRALMLELKNYEENERISSSGDAYVREGLQTEQIGIFPANAHVEVDISVQIAQPPQQSGVELKILSPSETIIRTVMIFAEGIFEGESLVIHPKDTQLNQQVSVALHPPKDVALDVHLKVLVGYRGSNYYQVLELMEQIPKFSMYALRDEPPTGQPKSAVTYQIPDRAQRVVLWLNQNFLLKKEIEASGPGELDLHFTALRSGEPLLIEMDNTGKLVLKTDDMDLAGEIIHGLATFLNLEKLEADVNFPDEIELLSNLLDKIEEFNSSHQEMTADIAENANMVRNLVVRAEDARLMGDMKNMRRWYGELMHINRDLRNNYKIRSNNHKELLTSLRNINQIIQKAGNLRVGTMKTVVISACRSALQENNRQMLFRVMKTGAP